MTETQNPKLCKDCKHCIPDRSWWALCIILPLAPLFAWRAMSLQWRDAVCGRTEERNEFWIGSPYTGERAKRAAHVRIKDCRQEREYGSCGPEAKYFEAKR